MSKVYDCCIINNELDMLELRLNILRDVVDYHVIVEAEQTHSGLPKRASVGMALASPRFAEFRDKLIYICLPDLAGDHSWAREYNHRASIAPLLERFGKPEPDDLIMVCDVDEIPSPASVVQVEDMATLAMDFYYYSFHHRVKMGWGIGACRWRIQQDANKIRTSDFGRSVVVLPNAGIHASYFMQPDQVVEKIKAFLHHDWAEHDPRVLDRKYIAEQIRIGGDIWGRDLEIEYVEHPDNLPQYVLDNQQKYIDLGWLETEKVATWQD